MGPMIDVKGASGSLYRYRLAEKDVAQTPMGGNFLYVREADGQPQVVYAAQTTNLADDIWKGWDKAQAKHGLTAVFVRLNVARVAREDELADLIAEHQPAMNK